AVIERGRALLERLSGVEEELVQVRWEAPQDTLNFPPRLNARVAHLARVAGAGDHRPTPQMRRLLEQLAAQVQEHLSVLRGIEEDEVRAFADLVRDSGIPLIAPEA